MSVSQTNRCLFHEPLRVAWKLSVKRDLLRIWRTRSLGFESPLGLLLERRLCREAGKTVLSHMTCRQVPVKRIVNRNMHIRITMAARRLSVIRKETRRGQSQNTTALNNAVDRNRWAALTTKASAVEWGLSPFVQCGTRY